MREASELLERVKGIEPSYEAWEASVLPLNYTRDRPLLTTPSLSRNSLIRRRAPWPGHRPV